MEQPVAIDDFMLCVAVALPGTYQQEDVYGVRGGMGRNGTEHSLGGRRNTCLISILMMGGWGLMPRAFYISLTSYARTLSRICVWRLTWLFVTIVMFLVSRLLPGFEHRCCG